MEVSGKQTLGGWVGGMAFLYLGLYGAFKCIKSEFLGCLYVKKL